MFSVTVNRGALGIVLSGSVRYSAGMGTCPVQSPGGYLFGARSSGGGGGYLYGVKSSWGGERRLP